MNFSLFWILLIVIDVNGFSGIKLKWERMKTDVAMRSDPFKRLTNIARSKGLPQVDSASSSTMAGAVMGGLLGGPLGAVLGAAVGNSASQSASQTTSFAEELGISREAVEGISRLGKELEFTESAVQSAVDQLEQVQRLRRELEGRVQREWEAASAALLAGDEREARAWLTKRETTRALLTKCTTDESEADSRVRKLDDLRGKLTSRLKDMEQLVTRARAADIATREEWAQQQEQEQE